MDTGEVALAMIITAQALAVALTVVILKLAIHHMDSIHMVPAILPWHNIWGITIIPPMDITMKCLDGLLFQGLQVMPVITTMVLWLLQRLWLLTF
jgi:hypothetical protein